MPKVRGESFGIVEIFSEVKEKHKCGYCKQESSSLSYGMWGHSLSAYDYQALIDRGWRRSGSYCYKPWMRETCCPLYTIRCDALNFKLNKSHKKALRRMKKFLQFGVTKEEQPPIDKALVTDSTEEPGDCTDAFMREQVLSKTPQCHANECESVCLKPKADIEKSLVKYTETVSCNVEKTKKISENDKAIQGLYPARAPCKKAKLIRMERKITKLKERGLEVIPPTRKPPNNEPKSVSAYFEEEDIIENPMHKLETRLVRRSEYTEDRQLFDQSHSVYEKYQMSVHGDSQAKCNRNQFEQFLVTSPIKFSDEKPGFVGFGSYHMQYLLDGDVIAVSVIDILPNCLSAVYFYYDTKFSFLSLGTYASLKELQLLTDLNLKVPDLRYYYMGYYIHNCPKMRYKAQYNPSELLCPETFTWHSLQHCLPLLDKSKYARFNPDSAAVDRDGQSERFISDVLVLFKRQAVKYEMYRKSKNSVDEYQVAEYAKLVGEKLATLMLLLYRN